MARKLIFVWCWILLYSMRRVKWTEALWGHNLGRNNFADGKSSRVLRMLTWGLRHPGIHTAGPFRPEKTNAASL